MTFQRRKLHLRQHIIFGRRHSFRRRVQIALCLVSIIPALMLMLFGYESWYNTALESVRGTVSNTLIQANKNISSTLSQVENTAMGVVINTNLTRLLSEDDLPTDPTLREDVYDELTSILLTNTNLISAIYVETPETVIFSRLNNEEKRSVYKIGIYGTEFEDIVLNMRSSSYWLDGADVDPVDESHRFEGVVYVRCATALPDISRSGYCAILSIMIRTAVLHSKITGMFNSYPGSCVMLVDRNDQVIASDGEIVESAYNDILALMEQESEPFYISVAGLNTQVSYVINENTGWRLVSLIPLASMTSDIYRSATISLAACLALVIICAYVSVYVTRSIIRTLDPLTDTMRRIERGDAEARVPEINTQELQVIGRVFNHMMDRYDDQVNRNAQQQSMLLSAQLNALQGQLSSHFLFNTLDAINWSLMERGEYDISASVAKLGDLLRYSMQDTEDMVPLKVELKMVSSYLDICKLRYEERFECSIDVDERFVDMEVPRFLLQPIVENGVVHGCEKNAGSGRITVHGFQEGKYLVIEVFSSGAQFPKEVLERIDRQRTLPLRQRTHIGLSNIVDRLQITYGAEYTLTVINRPGEGAVVRLLLPVPDYKEEDV